MTSSDKEFILNLRYMHKNSLIPLKMGNNIILSNFFPEISKDNLILFTLNILSENEAMLRTFDYFPLMVNINQASHSSSFTNGDIEKEALIRKQTIIYIKSLLNIRIFPLFTNNSTIQNKFFYFEKFRKDEENINSNHTKEKSKNIIYHHERKKDINEIFVDEKNDEDIMNGNEVQTFFKKNLILHQEIKVKEKLTDDTEKIDQTQESLKEESNPIEKNGIINQNYEEPSVNYKSDAEDKKLKMNVDDIIDKHSINDKSENSSRNGTNVQNEIKIEKDNSDYEKNISEMLKPHNEKSSKIITDSIISSSHQSSLSISSYYDNNMPRQFKNNDEEYNIIYNSLQTSIIPKKNLIIVDDEISIKESKIFPDTLDKTDILKPMIPPRLTRSSSKSLSNSNTELMGKKRRRHDTKLDSSSCTINNIVVNKSSENRESSNLNVNNTVIKNLNKLYEKEYIDNKEMKKVVETNDMLKSDYLNDNVKLINSPDSDILSNNIKQKCTICLDTINNISRLDKCQHEFCKDCIDQWAIFSNECPLCKVEFKKIIYWLSDNKQEKKVKKRKFKYEEEEEEPWLRNCAENCMVCDKNYDEHLLLVCDRCSYNICHTYCAGLDFIPDDEWLCSACSNRRRSRVNERNSNQSINNMSNFTPTEPNITYVKRRSVIVDDDSDEIKSRKNYSIASNSSNQLKNKNTKNINIPFSYKLNKDEVKRKSLNLNFSLNLHITNPERKHFRKKGKLVKKGISRNNQNRKSRYVNHNERVRTRRKYNLRKKKK